MKIKFLIISLLYFCVINTNEYCLDYSPLDEFFYGYINSSLNLNIQNGVNTPFIGLGCRNVFGKNGFDINTGIELYPLLRSKFKLFSYEINLNYLRFLKSNKKNKYYIGAGGSVLGVNSKPFFYVVRSPTIIFGKHIYDGNHLYIIQAKMNFPNSPRLYYNKHLYPMTKKEKMKRMFSANIFITAGYAF